MLGWHLRELGGVKENDKHFVSVKELSHDTENGSQKHKGKKNNTWVNCFVGGKNVTPACWIHINTKPPSFT